MALLRAFAIIACAAGCYQPDLRDCAVTCTPTSGCADGEVCSNGFCVAPGTSCNHEGIDAGSNAEKPDADPGVTVHIVITGKGQVVLNSNMTCDSDGNQNGQCTYSIPAHQTASLFAKISQLNHPFMMWTGMGCQGALPQCTVTPTPNMTIGAMFK